MLDNQTRMRSMLNLIEAVDQGKKINLNESFNGSLDEGPYTRLNTYRIKGQDMIDYLANESGAQVEMRGDEVGILTVDIISFPELAKLAANLAQQGKITPVAGPATRDMTGKGVFSNIKYPMSGIDEDSGSSSDVETLANDALDAAALSIQDALGVEHGDFAGMFFTGEAGETILEILRDYAREEIKNQSENDNSQTLDEGDVKRALHKKAESMSKADFISSVAGPEAPSMNMSAEEATEFWIAVNGDDDDEYSDEYSPVNGPGDDMSDIRPSRNLDESVKAKSKTGKLPSMAHIKKMCKDGKTVAEICKMHPDCDRAELKQMVADCKDKLSESGEGNSSTREKSVSDSDEGYDKWDPKHPNFVKNYKKFKASNPEGTLKSFIAHLKKGALAEGVRLNKFRQVADILKTLPENNRKILAKRHCKIFESNNSRFNSKKFMTYIGLNESLNEDNGNTVQVTFVNSGYGITGDEKPQTVEKLGMDIDQSGRPILYIKSPSYGDKMRADWDAKNNRWIVDQD
jgi:hypothetical protein